jgi:hypothetical protein
MFMIAAERDYLPSAARAAETRSSRAREAPYRLADMHG